MIQAEKDGCKDLRFLTFELNYNIIKGANMQKDEIRKLQNHFNNGAKVYYSVNDRVHLKGTKINGTVIGVIFKNVRNYPYLKIKWDELPETEKKFYDPFEIVKERTVNKRIKKEKKTYFNFYLEEKRKEC